MPGWPPATLALKRKNVEVLKAILSVPGLDLNLKTHKGSTVASIAVAQGESLSIVLWKVSCFDKNYDVEAARRSLKC